MPATKRKTSTKKRKTPNKSKSRAKEAPVEHELPGGFWRQISAVLMMALALFFVVTWFGQGGTITNNVHQFILKGLGFATYFIPALLVYLAVKIFRSEDNRVAIPVYIASILMIFWISGIAAIFKNGGIIGDWLNSLMLNVLSEGVVIFIYLVLIFITALFIFQLSPVTLFKGTKNLKNREKPESAEEIKDKKNKKLGQLEIKVNSGVGALDEAPAPAKTSSRKAVAEAVKPQEPTALVATTDPDWKMPSPNLLTKKQSPADAGNIQQNAFIIKNTFAEFGIDVEMEGANVGPRVTQYTLKAPGGVNLAKIAARDKELAYKLSATTIRIEAPIPGTQLIGVEVPNTRAAGVSLRGLIESEEWKKSHGPLTFAIGKDISGKPVVADLADMRHLLIAGTTGSGKSVMTNTLIMSLLYRNAPSDMRMIIVDPKKVEMRAYNDIPHLLTPIITNTEKALSAMKWAAGEMDRRYDLMADEGVKTISDYNKKMSKKPASKDGEEDKNGKMPYIVIVIDEMSDLMMQASKELEPLIVRIAQLGRAAGMHLVLATQKPIVKVITGLIKGNIPSRIAFRVLTSMESRIILDLSGAEKLLGKGDMLLSTEGTQNGPERIQGAWTPDEDIDKVTKFLKDQRPPQYNDEVIAQAVSLKGGGGDMGGLGRTFDPNDPLVRKAIEISLANGKFSTGALQSRLSKGHGWVSGLGYWLEDIGVVGPTRGTKPRELLINSMEEFDQLAEQT
ncbi:DNA translocase FtsK 4TM domain-containing protein [Candidatus Saccharibacteria bacterium]|nr:DNA translocase FtsK 4TM domain-containing protein [Candidatus Saccharibacteria bacterium]